MNSHGDSGNGSVVIKCPKCGGYNTVDVPLNSTSAPVLVEFLDHLNGSTPRVVVDAVARFVLRNGPVSEQEPGPVPSDMVE